MGQLELGNREQRWESSEQKKKNQIDKICFGESLKTVVFYPDIISK